MIAVDHDRFMDNPDLFMDKSADCGPVLVEGENHKSIVMLSEDAYSNLMENLHVPGEAPIMNGLWNQRGSLRRAEPQRMS